MIVAEAGPQAALTRRLFRMRKQNEMRASVAHALGPKPGCWCQGCMSGRAHWSYGMPRATDECEHGFDGPCGACDYRPEQPSAGSEPQAHSSADGLNDAERAFIETMESMPLRPKVQRAFDNAMAVRRATR